MALFRVLTVDYLHGVKDSLIGLMFIRKIQEEEQKEVKVEPEVKRERTVLERRREMQGIYRRPPEPPAKKDSCLKKLYQIYVMNFSFLIAWKFLIYLFSQISFWIMGNEEFGRSAGNCLIFPLFVVSRVVQTLWFSDISGACMRALNQKPPKQAQGFSYIIAETVISTIHSSFFLGQGILSKYLPIPIITPFIVFIHMALLNSMYCFEYFMDNYNLPFLQRREIFESHWPYFLGFGTPLALACSWSNDIFVNAAIFAFLFPFFIISSYKANWNRKYDEKIPTISFCRISYMLTQMVAKLVKHYTPNQFPPQKSSANN
uniref:Etoposide-induced protein 2.4 homolog n=1 Tax=Caenorhabditis japonica TaxID=281687 RepID=A0A8R1HPU4_CAEJA